MNPKWQPTAKLETLRQRQQLMRHIRNFFDKLNFLEVDTPLLSANATPDLHIDSVETSHGYLHTSPEYPMKRLLAAGYGPIYQICKVFRANESGRKHNPEFSMLEWYMPGWDDRQLINQVTDLIWHIGYKKEIKQTSYRKAFKQATELDPLSCSDLSLKEYAAIAAGRSCDEFSRNDCLDLVMSLVVEPSLDRHKITVITDFPATQAALAIKEEQSDGVWTARRFEVFSGGIELANGYSELVDAKEQKDRFNDENRQRLLSGKSEMPIDTNLISAMTHGMPSCAGVAMGLDRLMMLCLEKPHIDEVLTFPFDRA